MRSFHPYMLLDDKAIVTIYVRKPTQFEHLILLASNLLDIAGPTFVINCVIMLDLMKCMDFRIIFYCYSFTTVSSYVYIHIYTYTDSSLSFCSAALNVIRQS